MTVTLEFMRLLRSVMRYLDPEIFDEEFGQAPARNSNVQYPVRADRFERPPFQVWSIKLGGGKHSRDGAVRCSSICDILRLDYPNWLTRNSGPESSHESRFCNPCGKANREAPITAAELTGFRSHPSLKI
jgi:hypothetical protein